jgi:endonuclease I
LLSAAEVTIPLRVRIDVLGATSQPSPAQSPVPPSDETDAEAASALAELREASRRPYYDRDADDQAKEEYYREISANIGPSKLYQRLSELVTGTHENQPRYKPRVELYPWVDLQPNLKLRSIYSGKQYDPEELIREDLRIERERTTRLREKLLQESHLSPERLQDELVALEAALPYNAEHVVPQSWFGAQEPMRGDLHHLFACETGCNSFRGNIPYFDFEDFGEAERSECGKRVGNKFEPENGQGAVARATLYFLLRYPGEINRTAQEYDEDRLAVLLQWHDEFPVSEHERHRNMAIHKKQGNRNPLIDHPEWGPKIKFATGLG